MADYNSTIPSQHKGRRRGRNRHSRRKNKQPAQVDSISSLPDDILQHILSFVLTKFAIRTSVLSKRWRHVWCDTPSLSFHDEDAAWIDETLNRYTAHKMIRFHLYGLNNSISYFNKWIEFAMSRNVENLYITFLLDDNVRFEFPDFFFNNSSLKKLNLNVWLLPAYMNPTCFVSWTSLKKLSLGNCKLPDESIAKILLGCPILESLTLDGCYELRFLDLSKYPNVTTLRVCDNCNMEPTEIVAPHIHSLKLFKPALPCTLLDVSSLTEAKLDAFYSQENFNAYFLQVELLEILHNVEKLTLGECFLQILSVAELHGHPFPKFKVKALTLKTSISQYVIPGIERMLRNSLHLKKITLHIKTDVDITPDKDFDTYARNLINPDQTWRSKNGVRWNKDRLHVRSNHVVSFMELMLQNAEALETLVLQFQDRYCKFKELVPTLWNENNVSIVLSTKPTEMAV